MKSFCFMLFFFFFLIIPLQRRLCYFYNIIMLNMYFLQLICIHDFLLEKSLVKRRRHVNPSGLIISCYYRREIGMHGWIMRPARYTTRRIMAPHAACYSISLYPLPSLFIARCLPQRSPPVNGRRERSRVDA